LIIIFWRRLLLVVVGGGHGASKTENSSWQKQIKAKTQRENDIQISGTPRHYIGESLTTKGRHRMKPGQKWAPRRPHHQVTRPAGGLRHGVLWCLRAPFPTRFHLVNFHI
jgi:hypothetical protein